MIEGIGAYLAAANFSSSSSSGRSESPTRNSCRPLRVTAGSRMEHVPRVTPCATCHALIGVCADSGGFDLTRGSHVAKLDNDGANEVHWTLIGRLILILGKSFWKFP